MAYRVPDPLYTALLWPSLTGEGTGNLADTAGYRTALR